MTTRPQLSADLGPRRGVLRALDRDTEVGAVELFFDLVYVFTIIQLSHYLVAHLSWEGAAQAGVLFLAVWWGWNYTAWAMNWLDPEHAAVRALLALLMLASLAMAIAIPDAFSEAALVFVAGYLVLQLVRSGFMVAAFRGHRMARNYAQLLAWSAIAAVPWVAGALLEGWRLELWALAVLLDYAAPQVGFWLPGAGGTPMETWPLDEAHLAERNRLVFIIALGESILVLGATLSHVELTGTVLLAALTGFVTILLLWWLYFSYRLGNAEHHLPDHVDPTTMARAAFAYGHALMVGGAIVVAVGIEEVTLHPDEHAGWPVAAVVLGGPALYLLGNLLYNAARNQLLPRSRVVALVALAVTAALAPVVSAVVLALVVLAVLAVLAVTTGELRARPVG